VLLFRIGVTDISQAVGTAQPRRCVVVRTSLQSCPSSSETASTLGNQHRFTVASASRLEMWGTSVAVAFICYSPRAAHWDHANWASTSLSPSSLWMLGKLSTANLGCLATFVRTPSRKLVKALALRSPRQSETPQTLPRVRSS